LLNVFFFFFFFFFVRYKHKSVIDLILKESTDDVNAKQRSGYTPLLLAALGCKAQPQAIVVNQLLRSGADKSARSPRGETARDICLKQGCARCAAVTATDSDLQVEIIF
jgi:ankyrin repeat protein